MRDYCPRIVLIRTAKQSPVVTDGPVVALYQAEVSTVRRRIAGLAMACLGLTGMSVVGCGVSPSSRALRAAPTSSRSTWRTLQVGAVSLRIPPGWHPGHQVTLSYAPVVSGWGALVPVNTFYGPIQFAHPYVGTQYAVNGGQVSFQLRLETRGGDLYQLDVAAPVAQRALVHRVVQTLKLPAPATATALVHQFNAHHVAPDGPSYVRTSLGPSQWLLVFGDPATAMENYDLFHSPDGGRRWMLVNATPFVSAPHTAPRVFPGSLGEPAMLFWTAHDGILAEATGFSPRGLLLYRTTNAGYTWQLQAIGPRNQITGGTRPHVTDHQGTLTVSVRLGSGQVFRTTSTNGGKTWNPQ